MKLKFYVI